jgi:hypothetical protein
MKYLELTQNKYAIVDDEDFEYLNQWKWQWNNANRSKFGYAHRTERIKGTKMKLHHKMHRLVMNAERGQIIDHVNGNTLDNRKENLRFCTLSQNNQNQAISSRNRSGYKGVSWHKATSRWRVTINTDKQISLGYYSDIREAARIYNKAAKKYFGEFAHLNVLK